jgi:hypothetical protein
MLPKRLSLKIFATTEPPTFDLFVPIFQRWIQRQAVEGILIDVIDYKHVPNGPGVVLIGHEGDYGFDLMDGGAGVRYTLKWHTVTSLSQQIHLGRARVLQAAQVLSKEKALKGIQFDETRLLLKFLDRLHFPNTAEHFAGLQESLAGGLGLEPSALSYVPTDARACLTVEINGQVLPSPS